MAQSENVQQHVDYMLRSPYAPRYMIAKQIKTELLFNGGNWIRPIPASQKTVRGPHPQMTCLDEIDEMERSIYDAAMGQAMKRPNARDVEIPEMVVASSTWQNPVGTFQSVRDEALRKHLPIRTWCYQEVLKPHGWMDPEFIDRKRASVPAEMFRVEYELGEPAGDSRAFDLTKLNKYFTDDFTPLEERHQDNDDTWVYEQPNTFATYAAGVDWAKSVDKTVMVVVRTDVTPWRTVYLRILNRRPWPYMIDQFNQLVTKYQAVSAHDATGLGNVVHDLVDERTIKVVMMGADRVKLLTEYITAVEQGKYCLPKGTPLFIAHKSVTVDEVFAPGRWNSHLHDEVAACAIAHRAATRMASPSGPAMVPRQSNDPPLMNWQKALNAPTGPSETVVARQGDISYIEESNETAVFWLN
jgi:hypothetical protein